MSRNAARFDPATARRRSMIAKVHLAKKQLAIMDDDYRQMLMDVTGKASCADCTEAELDRLIGHLRKKGFADRIKDGRRPASHPVAKKARAMWISLYHLNVVRDPSEKALESFGKRQLGVDRLAWADQRQGYRLIEALKDMARREGWQQDIPAGVTDPIVFLQRELCKAILVKLKAKGVVPANWDLAAASWRLAGEGVPPITFTGDSVRWTEIATALGVILRRHG